MPLKRGYHSATNLPGIHESDDETNDVELQAESLSSAERDHQQLRRISSAPMGSRRLSTSMGRRASINDALNQTRVNNDDRTTPVKYRDYLRAERNLKAAAMHHHSLHPPLTSNGIPSPRSPRHPHVSPAAGASDFFSLASLSEQPEGLDYSDSHEQINFGDDQSKEAKQRRRERKREEAYRRNVHNLAHHGRRGSIMATDTKLWETLMDTDEDMEIEEEILRSGHMTGEEDVVDDQHNDDDGVVPFYSPPMQRVFYGKPQVLPHVNWGDLFLDLFFVAAAYNLGVLLISSMNESEWLRGLLYFLAIFGALYRTWFNDLTFSSRYTVLDHLHHMVWGLKFFAICVAIIFITPLNLMGNPKSIDTPAFILALLVENLITFCLNVEIYFKAVGDRTPIKSHARRMILHEDLPTMFFYIVAFVLATLAYYHVDIYGNYSSIGDGYGRMLASAADIDCSSGGRLLLSRMLGASEVGCPSEGYRKLAADDDDGCTCHTGIKFSTDDIPMAIVFFSYCFHMVFSFLKQLALASKEKDIRDRFVPNNLDYVIHRYGEWIMLMIGEGILSLLIVETTESVEYFVVSCFGVLTVMGIHVLVFESQPSTSDGHAIYRSLRAQLIFGILVQFLSLGLIAFGVSFKLMLTTIVSNNAKYGSYESRRLAATPSVSEDATSALFSASLAIVLITLEFMLANHKGAKGTYKRLFNSRDGGQFGIIKFVNKPLVVLTLLKVGLIAFTATLSQWERSLTEVSVIAFAIVVAMSISRIIGWGLVHKEDEIRQMLKTLRSAPGSFKSSASALRRTVSDELVNLFNKSGSDSSTFMTPQEEVDELSQDKEVWDTSFDCIIAFTRDGRLEYVNERALVEFGYRLPSEILGFDVSILFGGKGDDDDPLQLRKLEASSLPTKVIGQPKDGQEYTLHGKRKDGTEFACMVGLKPIVDTEFISGFIRKSAHLGLEKTSMEGSIATAEKCGHLSQLMDAVKRGDSYEITILVDQGDVDVNETCSIGRTALHEAVAQGSESIVELLCEKGGDVNAEDNERKRPMDLLDERKHPRLMSILQKYGATSSTRPAKKVSLPKTTTSSDIIFEDAFDAIIICNSYGLIQKLNNTAVVLLCYTNKEELMGRRISMICADIDSASNTHQPITKARRKDGSEFLCMVVSKENEHTRLGTWWIRDMSAFDQAGIGLSTNKQGDLKSEQEYKA